MNPYSIIISDEAMEDIDKIVYYIHSELKEPYTARKYHDDLIHTIQKLSFYAGSVGANEYVQAMFGADAHHVIFKKTAIIFYLEGNTVYIERVIAGSMIH